jgi:hypothetical protein
MALALTDVQRDSILHIVYEYAHLVNASDMLAAVEKVTGKSGSPGETGDLWRVVPIIPIIGSRPVLSLSRRLWLSRSSCTVCRLFVQVAPTRKY